MYNNYSQSNIYLPPITTVNQTEPDNSHRYPNSMSLDYFQYAKNLLKNANLSLIQKDKPYMPSYLTQNYYNPNSKQYRYNYNNDEANQNKHQDLMVGDNIIYEKKANEKLITDYNLPNINLHKIPKAEKVTQTDKELMPLNLEKNNEEKKLTNKEIAKKKRKALFVIKKVKQIHCWIQAGKILSEFTDSLVEYKKNNIKYMEAMDRNLKYLAQDIKPVLGNIEKYVTEFFYKTIIYDNEHPSYKKNSIFIVKSFIDRLFTDFTSAYPNKKSIPMRIRIIFKRIFNNDIPLPFNFLTNFEFNRLEYDHNLKLKNINREKGGMIICFIMFYRVLILNLFKFHFKTFPSLLSLRPRQEDIEIKLLEKQVMYNINLSHSLDVAEGNVDNPKNAKDYSMAMLNDFFEKIDFNNGINDYVNFEGVEDKDDMHKFDYIINNKRRNHNINYILDKDDLSEPPAPPPNKINIDNDNTKSRKKKKNKRNILMDEDIVDDVNNNNNNNNKYDTTTNNNKVLSEEDIKNFNNKGKNNNNTNNDKNKIQILKNLEKDDKFLSKFSNLNKQKEILKKEGLTKVKLPTFLYKRILFDEYHKLQKRITHNFYFIINVLDYIFREAFQYNTPIFRDHFKEVHCYRYMVMNASNKDYKQLDNIGLVDDKFMYRTKTSKFIVDNAPWLKMYIYNTFELCCDMASNIMDNKF